MDSNKAREECYKDTASDDSLDMKHLRWLIWNQASFTSVCP